MKLLLVILAVTVLIPLLLSVRGHAEEPASKLAHTRTEFSFTVDAPFEQVVPLFGAHEERKWAEGWDPQFVYPTPAHDQQGEIFKVAHRQHTSVWINTLFDVVGGHVQYAYVLGDAMATLIDIHATRQGPQKTAVTVVYERTALLPEANDHVQHFAKGDANGGNEWGEAMNAYFAKMDKAAR
jgi:hypothetical protein